MIIRFKKTRRVEFVVPTRKTSMSPKRNCVFLKCRLIGGASDTLNKATMLLPGKTWSYLYGIITGDMPERKKILFKWGVTESTLSDCGDLVQNIKHIVQECAPPPPSKKCQGTWDDTHIASPEAISRIESPDSENFKPK